MKKNNVENEASTMETAPVEYPVGEMQLIPDYSMAAKLEPALKDFAIFSIPFEELSELRAEMGVGGNETIGRFDMPRVKMPAQGMRQFIMPDGTAQAEFKGVIVAFKDTRVYYRDATSQGTPPDCSSEDCRVGRGKIRPDMERTGTFDCAKCPHNQWGSNQNGSGGKACAERRLLAIQMEEGLVPVLLNVPVTSVRPLAERMRGIISTHKSLINNFLLTFKTTEAVSGKGIKYSKLEIDPDKVVKLSDDVKPYMKAMREAAKSMLDSIPKQEIVFEDIDTVTIEAEM